MIDSNIHLELVVGIHAFSVVRGPGALHEPAIWTESAKRSPGIQSTDSITPTTRGAVPIIEQHTPYTTRPAWHGWMDGMRMAPWDHHAGKKSFRGFQARTSFHHVLL